SEEKLAHLEQPLTPLPLPIAPQAVRVTFEVLFDAQNEVTCLMLVKAFHACKQEDGQSVSAYILKMKGYLDSFERLRYVMPKEFGMSLILNSLNKDYDQFVQNYNMHSIGNSIVELHVMLKLYKKCIPKNAKTPVVLAIREGKIQKDKKKPRGSKGKDKGKNKLAYAPKSKIPPSPKRDNPAKDSVCHHYKEVGHWRINCPSYQVKEEEE
nr:zinc finger, CCHC-type [Tanacetum cinerariifolium]